MSVSLSSGSGSGAGTALSAPSGGLPAIQGPQVKTPEQIAESILGLKQTVTKTIGDLFLVPNEQHQMETLEKLKQHPSVGNTILFTSAFFGLNAAAARILKFPQTSFTLIAFDYSTIIECFWKKFNKIICKAKTKEETISHVITLIEKEAHCFFHPKMRAQLKATVLQAFKTEIEEGLSWLSSNESFTAIQNVFKTNRFIFFPLDFSDTTKVSALGQRLKELSLKLDFVYLSNIREALETERKSLEIFRKSIAGLNAPKETIFIDTIPRPGGALVEANPHNLYQRYITDLSTVDLKTLFPSSPPFVLTSYTHMKFGNNTYGFYLEKLTSFLPYPAPPNTPLISAPCKQPEKTHSDSKGSGR